MPTRVGSPSLARSSGNDERATDALRSGSAGARDLLDGRPCRTGGAAAVGAVEQRAAGARHRLPAGSNYTSRHIPFLYFDDIVNGPNMLCANTNVDFSQFAADLAAGTYRYMWITPNLIDDGHGGPLPIPGIEDPVKDLQATDSWLLSRQLSGHH
jgi:hypothetical protein